MKEIIKRRLTESIGTGELINIIYAGGHEPGTSRFIRPIKMEGDKVWAQCYVTNKVKLFNIEKITLANSDEINYSGHLKEPETLRDAIAPFIEQLKTSGWKIEISDHEIALFSYFKNGKQRKTATVAIIHYECGEEYNNTKSRPWYVGGHSYKYLRKAIQKFVEIAALYSPLTTPQNTIGSINTR